MVPTNATAKKGKEVKDEVVAEVPVVFLSAGSDTSVNRLQFQGGIPTQLEECTANFKKNVKHLKLELPKQEGAGKSAFLYHKPAIRETTVYRGEGYANLGIVNNAVGFIKDGSFFMLPIRDVYDMQYLLPEKARPKGKGGRAGKRMADDDLSDDDTIFEEEERAKPAATGPVRAKFARVETDYQKKRREQSSLYNQKLQDEDLWIPLRVREKNPAILYSGDIENSKVSAPLELKDGKTPLENLI